MSRFDLIYEQAFTDTDTILVTHNLSRYVFNLRLIISGDPRLSQRELVRDIELSQNRIQEITNIICVADTAGSLNGKYFILEEIVGTVAFWFDHGDAGTPEPAHGADRSVEITTVANNDPVGTVGDKVYAAIIADPSFPEGTNNGAGTLTIENFDYGPMTLQSAGDSGFTVTENTAGVDDAINECTVRLIGAYTGTIQIIAEDTIQSPYYTVDEKISSQLETALSGTFPVKYEYGGNSNVGRILEYTSFDNSQNSPYLVVGDGKLRAISFNNSASSTGAIGVYKVASPTDILLYTFTYTAVLSKIDKGLDISVFDDDRVYVKQDSGTSQKPVIVIYFQTI